MCLLLSTQTVPSQRKAEGEARDSALARRCQPCFCSPFGQGKIQKENNYAEGRGMELTRDPCAHPWLRQPQREGKALLAAVLWERRSCLPEGFYFPLIPNIHTVQSAIATSDAHTSPRSCWDNAADAGKAKLSTAPPVKICCTDGLKPLLGLKIREFP